MYKGDYAEDATVYFTWDTNASLGASVTRATDGSIVVYKDGGDTESAAGVVDTEDFDGRTGVHLCTIDTSADAFYATGSDYHVILHTATIDGQTVNATIAHFSIENRSSQIIDAVVDAIKAKTDNLPADPADDSDIDAQLAAINALATAIKTLADKLEGMVQVAGALHQFTAAALAQGPAGTGGGFPRAE